MDGEIEYPARFYIKGGRIKCDELGTVIVTAPSTGWFIVQNHYGNVRVIPMPGPT